MMRNAKFWIPMIVFQLVYGVAIFGLTRDYYLYGPDRSGARLPATDRTTSGSPPVIPRPGGAIPSSSMLDGAAVKDPVEVSRQADQYFADANYEAAAIYYDQLRLFAPNDVDTLNNLGLTLHYLNRSDEALRWLNEGVAIDPENQRIWLTLGFVNVQLGKTDAAQKALTTATLIGDDEAIRKSAMEMLRDLP